MSWECRQTGSIKQINKPELKPDPGLTNDISFDPKQLYTFFRDFRLPDIEITHKGKEWIITLDSIQELVPHQDYEPFIQAWWRLIPAYTSLGLTKSSDKLVALSGITNTVLRNIHLRNYQGLWGGNYLLYELTWYVDPKKAEGTGGFESHLDTRPLAPTWSWAILTSGRICNDVAFRGPPGLDCKPYMGTPVETSFEHALPYSPWTWLQNLSMDLKAHHRSGTIMRRQSSDAGSPHFEVSIEPTGHYSDRPENEKFDFRPDVAEDFSINRPVAVTCAHWYHYSKDWETFHEDEHVDVFLVLQKLKVREDQQANVFSEDNSVVFDIQSTRSDGEFSIGFPVKFHLHKARDEAFLNTRTFRRIGYLEARYSDTRPFEEGLEDRMWTSFRLI